MKDIRWARLATDDLQRIARWVGEIDEGLARRMIEETVGATHLLRDHPEAGPIELYGSRRKRRVRGTPINLFYRVAGKQVRILRILHVAQDQTRN